MSKRIINVATANGALPVEAEVFGNWAVHKAVFSLSRYTITHVPSGLCATEHSLLMLGLTTKKSLVVLAKILGDQFPKKVVTPAVGRRMFAAFRLHTKHAEQAMRKARAR